MDPGKIHEEDADIVHIWRQDEYHPPHLRGGTGTSKE